MEANEENMNSANFNILIKQEVVDEISEGEQTKCQSEFQPLFLTNKYEVKDFDVALDQLNDINAVNAEDMFIQTSDLLRIKQEIDIKPELELLQQEFDQKLKPLKQETNILNYLDQPCSSNKTQRKFLNAYKKTVKKVSKAKKKYPCPVCRKCFDTSKATSRHLDIHFNKKFVSCFFCGKFFMHKIEFLHHYFIHFINFKKIQPQRSNLKYLDGVIHQNGNSFKCALCPSTFKGKYSLKYHILFKHLGIKPYKCAYCPKRFGHKSYLKGHAIMHTGEKPYLCYLCSRSFAKSQYLKYHLKTHANEKRFECEFCLKRFSQKASLIDHRRIHTGEKPYLCDVCSKAFSRKHELRRHSLVHTGIQPYKCDICLRAFKKRDNLKLHMLNHTGEKPFKCETCLKEFKAKHNLKIHIRVHTGERPFECKLCSKTFKVKPTLNQHIKSHHETIKPFKCEICFKDFTRRGSLTSHNRTHTKEKRYKCELCNTGYAAKITLRKHNNLVHPTLNSTEYEINNLIT